MTSFVTFNAGNMAEVKCFIDEVPIPGDTVELDGRLRTVRSRVFIIDFVGAPAGRIKEIRINLKDHYDSSY